MAIEGLSLAIGLEIFFLIQNMSEVRSRPKASENAKVMKRPRFLFISRLVRSPRAPVRSHPSTQGNFGQHLLVYSSSIERGNFFVLVRFNASYLCQSLGVFCFGYRAFVKKQYHENPQNCPKSPQLTVCSKFHLYYKLCTVI